MIDQLLLLLCLVLLITIIVFPSFGSCLIKFEFQQYLTSASSANLLEEVDAELSTKEVPPFHAQCRAALRGY